MTSLSFFENVWTSPKKLTYDNDDLTICLSTIVLIFVLQPYFLVKDQPYIDVVTSLTYSPPFVESKVFIKMEGHTLLYTNGSSDTCRLTFRIVLNKGPLKIRYPQYALKPILGPIFPGVVYGASLTYCVVARYGVIRRWRRILCIFPTLLLVNRFMKSFLKILENI